MQRARDYVEHLKRKPVHVRERIALMSSGAVVFVVALGYLAALVSSDRLALGNVPETPVVAERQDFSALLGAAAAFSRSNEEGSVTVVETSSSSTMEAEDQSSATVIPF